VSVVVPVRNGAATIGDCLASLRAVAYPPAQRELIVVDNGSTDGTAAIVDRSADVRRVVETRSGPSCARNRGIRESRGAILAFIDADCMASRGWLDELVDGFDGPGVGGVAGEIRGFLPRTPAERYMDVTHRHWQQHALGGAWAFASAANVAFRRSTFDRIGLFDSRLSSGEDKDFGRRFFEDGTLAFRYRPKAVVFHRHKPTMREFVAQHLRWSHGNALLHAKYDIPWGLGDELRKYGDVLQAAAALVRASTRHALRGGEVMQVYTPLFELVRRLTYRVGGARWLVTRHALKARFASGEDAHE
jgi:glycosyltransferase involved in cell wall biosynthesis